MKSLAILLAASLATATGLTVTNLQAQDMITSDPVPAVEEVPAPEPITEPLVDDMPAASEPGDANLLVEPLPPISDDGGVSEGGRLKVPKIQPDKEEAPAVDWRQEMRLRQLQTKFEAEPALADLKNAAATATRDSEKRLYLIQYYDALFAKIRKADPSLTEVVAKLQESKTRDLVPEQIEPSVPPGELPAPAPRVQAEPKVKERKVKVAKVEKVTETSTTETVETTVSAPASKKARKVVPEAAPEAAPAMVAEPAPKVSKVKPEKTPKVKKAKPAPTPAPPLTPEERRKLPWHML